MTSEDRIGGTDKAVLLSKSCSKYEACFHFHFRGFLPFSNVIVLLTWRQPTSRISICTSSEHGMKIACASDLPFNIRRTNREIILVLAGCTIQLPPALEHRMISRVHFIFIVQGNKSSTMHKTGNVA
eukprot:GHVU01067432.1.p1 GENE.GHVU01067432.1~~GHVU01067432.1.p1  ORF type:complete len:127 (+),score=6.68 GHVU01067432.1:842-1222(+)